MPELVYLVIYGTVLFNICIRRRHICLRLVVIIVGHKILNRVFREKLFKFRIKLRSQRLVVCYNQRRLSQLLYDIGHGKGLAGAGDAQQRLKLIAASEPVRKRLYSLRLVSCRFEIRNELKIHLHCPPSHSRYKAPESALYRRRCFFRHEKSGHISTF